MNLLTSLLNNCPGTQASSPAFKEVRSPGRTIASRGAQPNSPAPLAGRGLGAGLFSRRCAAKLPRLACGEGARQGTAGGNACAPGQHNCNKFCKVSDTRRYPYLAPNLPCRLQIPRYPHQRHPAPHPRQQLPRLHTTHRDPRHHYLRLLSKCAAKIVK